MEILKAGSVVTDGRSVTIGAPLIRASATYPPPEPTVAGALATIARHLKGITASVEELRTLLEKQKEA